MVDPNMHQVHGHRLKSRGHTVAGIEHNEEGFVDMNGDRGKEAESTKTYRGQDKGLLQVYLLEKGSVEAQKVCFFN